MLLALDLHRCAQMLAAVPGAPAFEIQRLRRVLLSHAETLWPMPSTGEERPRPTARKGFAP
jgi:hypothetical protein